MTTKQKQAILKKARSLCLSGLNDNTYEFYLNLSNSEIRCIELAGGQYSSFNDDSLKYLAGGTFDSAYLTPYQFYIYVIRPQILKSI